VSPFLLRGQREAEEKGRRKGSKVLREGGGVGGVGERKIGGGEEVNRGHRNGSYAV
jgi:hypothetical protein